jgi:hypothetical protein
MCTDTSLSAVDIIRLYGLRFKIECSLDDVGGSKLGGLKINE